MLREPRQDRWIPRPVLHDLARRLHEVPLGLRAAEPGELGPGEAHVQDVAELVEERLTSPWRRSDGRSRRRRREVRDDRADRRDVLAIGAAMADDERERGGVAELALAREEVGVEVRRSSPEAAIADLVQPDAVVPGVAPRARRDTRARSTSPVIANMPSIVGSSGKYSLMAVLVDAVLGPPQRVVVVAPVPRGDRRVVAVGVSSPSSRSSSARPSPPATAAAPRRTSARARGAAPSSAPSRSAPTSARRATRRSAAEVERLVEQRPVVARRPGSSSS